MATPKYIFTVSNGQLLVELNNSSLDFDGDESKTYESPTLDLFKDTIVLLDFGIFVKPFKIENIETINLVVPTDIKNAFDLLLALLPNEDSIPDASETVAGKVSVGTQTFGGNKTIVGESATVGNALTVQNLSHTKILEVGNKGHLIQRPVNRSNYVYSLYDVDGSLAFGLYIGGTGALTMEAYDASNILYFQFSPTALNYFLPSFHVGDNVGEPSAKLSVKSTTQGFLPPRMTSAQKNAIENPKAGLMVFDTTLKKLCIFTTVWETITSI